MDEIIIPCQASIYFYKSLVEEILHLSNVTEPYSKASSIGFSWAFFYQFQQNDRMNVLTSNKKKFPLQTMKYTIFSWSLPSTTTDPNGGVKSITSTDSCIYAYNHHCLVMDNNHILYITAPKELALTHHYRSTCNKYVTGDMACIMPNANYSVSYVSRYKKDILKNIEHILKETDV